MLERPNERLLLPPKPFHFTTFVRVVLATGFGGLGGVYDDVFLVRLVTDVDGLLLEVCPVALMKLCLQTYQPWVLQVLNGDRTGS
ncbi:hypothetical protein [Thalassospira xiamenensis]|nr:hypothetical protein [Thalassospira xiamenensis]